MPWADLHCHTQASDGSLSPVELIRLAKEMGLQGLSITDHDTTSAYAQAVPAAQEMGIRLGAGVEFSCVFEENDVHLLGYDFELASSQIQTLCDAHQRRREHRNLAMLDKLRQNGIDISAQELMQQGKEGSIGRPHMAQVMMQKGYVKTLREAFRCYLGEGKLCYVRGKSFSVDETIEAIHASKGKAFLAHPHLLPASFPIDLLCQKAFDGIECWYAKLAEKTAHPWIEMARKKGWLISGGSDFHGATKPDISLGCQGVDQTAFNQIFEHPLT